MIIGYKCGDAQQLVICIIDYTHSPTTNPTSLNPTTLNPTNMPTLSPGFVPETSMENKQHKNENDNKHSYGFGNLIIIAILILLCIFIMTMIYKIRKKKHEVFIQKKDRILLTVQEQNL